MLELGSLLFIRNPDGTLKKSGLAFFLFFFIGMISSLYLIIES